MAGLQGISAGVVQGLQLWDQQRARELQEEQLGFEKGQAQRQYEMDVAAAQRAEKQIDIQERQLGLGESEEERRAAEFQFKMSPEQQALGIRAAEAEAGLREAQAGSYRSETAVRQEALRQARREREGRAKLLALMFTLEDPEVAALHEKVRQGTVPVTPEETAKISQALYSTELSTRVGAERKATELYKSSPAFRKQLEQYGTVETKYDRVRGQPREGQPREGRQVLVIREQVPSEKPVSGDPKTRAPLQGVTRFTTKEIPLEDLVFKVSELPTPSEVTDKNTGKIVPLLNEKLSSPLLPGIVISNVAPATEEKDSRPDGKVITMTPEQRTQDIQKRYKDMNLMGQALAKWKSKGGSTEEFMEILWNNPELRSKILGETATPKESKEYTAAVNSRMRTLTPEGFEATPEIRERAVMEVRQDWGLPPLEEAEGTEVEDEFSEFRMK